MAKNIHPIFDKLVGRSVRENILKQNSRVIWMTGLSGSGKSTIAEALERKLFKNDFFCQVLDGDNIRSGINNNLSFELEDRLENIRRISEVSKLFLNSGVITINSFISPTIKMRDMAKEIIGVDNFIEIYIKASLEMCEERDVKGLYKKARAGEIKGFTGIDSPYEVPVDPAWVVDTGADDVDTSVEKLYDFLLPTLTFEQ